MASILWAFLSCDGIFSASIWLKVTRCLPPLVLSSSISTESRSRPQYGVRQAWLSSSSWIRCSMDSTRTQRLIRWNQSQLRFSQPPRPSLRWWDASAEQTVHHFDALAGPRTYHAQTSASAALSARMMRTLEMTCYRPVTVMMMMCNSSATCTCHWFCYFTLILSWAISESCRTFIIKDEHNNLSCGYV